MGESEYKEHVSDQTEDASTSASHDRLSDTEEISGYNTVIHLYALLTYVLLFHCHQ